jgi:hypothetical protein
VANLKEISKLRFDALASYARSPWIVFLARELRWFEFANERLLATAVIDSDNQYSGVFMAKDPQERYRWVGQTDYVGSLDEATAGLPAKAEALLSENDAYFVQDEDETPPVDFFTPVVEAARLHTGFRQLSELEGFSPAQEIIGPMMRWYKDADGNFIEQFQTTGFNPRIWELYLFAAFNEAGYIIDRSHQVPDFTVTGPLGELCVEATTLNPSQDASGAAAAPPPTETDDEIRAYLKEYLPLRYARSLTTKLNKRYWEASNVTGKPLLFAIQDFHAPMSMTWTSSSLPLFLYGYDHDAKRGDGGELLVVPKKIESHQWGNKKVDSGFFNQPESEHISAVIRNTSGTLSKFNRIGVIAGFGSDRVVLIREGTMVDHDSNASEPNSFRVRVQRGNYHETWLEGMDVFHNPNANCPLDAAALPGAAHHRCLNGGVIESITPQWHPIGSLTYIFVSPKERPMAAE